MTGVQAFLQVNSTNEGIDCFWPTKVPYEDNEEIKKNCYLKKYEKAEKHTC